MYTPEQVAQQINTAKPDFTEFNKILNRNVTPVLISHINNTIDTPTKLFKAELALMYHQTHPQKYIGSDNEKAIHEAIVKHLTTRTAVQANQGIWREYSLNKFKRTPDLFILNFIESTKLYLPSYLYKKLNPSTSTVTIKQLKDDTFTLGVFKSYVNNKPNSISSVQAEAYVKSIDNFKSTKHEYMQLILDNCPKPSLKLQSLLEGKLPNQCELDNPTKYMTLRKYKLSRNNQHYNRVLSSSHIFNTRDSEYKPFITNLPRIPTPDIPQTEYLIDVLTKLQVDELLSSNATTQVFIESLAEHLNLPEYKEMINHNLERFKLQIKAYEAVINLFKDNYEPINLHGISQANTTSNQGIRTGSAST